MRVTFWGAAETVTGSRFLVETGGRRLLIDCGLFQGVKRIRRRNWDAFPVDPASIDAVVLTHAHIDHTGYLPALVRDGFRGQIWCTPATADLGQILLPDSAHIHEEDARYANKRRSSRHQPAVPLYTSQDAQQALKAFRPHHFLDPFEPVPGVEVLFSPVGHILGAAAVRVADEETSVLFTGDVGRPVDPVMKAPGPAPLADHVVTESTYGDRVHEQSDPSDDLADVVVRTMERGGTLLIPVFAVGRAQSALHLLSELMTSGRVPSVPIYMNSPMAVSATDLFCDHLEEHRLTVQQCEAMCEDVVFVRSVEESKQLTSRSGPMIVLSASGMLTGGRVLHHLQQVGPDRRSTVLLVGYQAAGTRGQALGGGATRVKVFGSYVPIRAEVARIDGLSAHADANELTDWFRSSELAPRTTYIVHGEPGSSDALRRSLRDDLGWNTNVPVHGDAVELA